MFPEQLKRTLETPRPVDNVIPETRPQFRQERRLPIPPYDRVAGSVAQRMALSVPQNNSCFPYSRPSGPSHQNSQRPRQHVDRDG